MPLKQPYCLHTYVCNFPNQLTSYDGESITYDASGNPTNYLGATLVWEGQRLKSYTPKASSSGHANSYVYSYDENGIRTRKTIGSTVTDYYYNGTLLMGTVKTTTNSDGSTTTSKLRFSYDANGKVVAVNYNGNYYYYLRNAQSDIVKLIDKTGATVVEYTYDSWGKLLSTSGSLASTLGKNNPFRYRGYVYDEETGFYYLQSRYYNPEVGRFISADVLLSTGQGVIGHNAYAYCLNNPINGIDPDGCWPFFVVTAIVGAVVGAVAGGIIAAQNGGNVLTGIGIGAASGALIGTGVGAAAGAALAGSITATTGAVVAGGGTLAATVSAGGVGAGAAYVANNLAQAANNITPAAQTVASKMQDVATKGKNGELLSGLVKNTTRIPSLTGTAAYRIPDGLDMSIKVLSEVKNYTGKLSYTSQLKDFVMWSQANGFEMHLYTNAILTGPLQKIVDSGIIKLYPLK